MNIQNISFYPAVCNFRTLKKENTYLKSDIVQNNNYNPIYYKDYNISFGERLFRTPENFFEQDFNKENMPETMKQYLNADYENRSHIPPAQMMKIIFNDIESAETLDEVKELYPEEPLFMNLHSMSSKKYREGIMAEINLMKEPDKSLFKNGKDDLGMYILKKIYLEGKTLKEINKDFKKDISRYYEGLSDINYRDLANFGIKFPRQAFWHSFIATREDFPYVSVRRKDAEFHANEKAKKELTLKDIKDGNFVDKRPPKYNLKDYELKKMTDAFLKGKGNKKETEKELKHKIDSKDPKLLFLQKYMGAIMSVSLDRVHASDEMRAFFEDSENMTKSAKERFKKYWDNSPEMKALQSIVMSDTIKLFFLTYGADGNNDEFRELLAYANSIKPAREERLRLHEIKQAEYDELFKQIQNPQEIQTESPHDEPGDMEDIIRTAAQNENTDYCEFEYNGQAIHVVGDMEEYNRNALLHQHENFMPEQYLNKYIKYIYKNYGQNSKLILSNIYYDDMLDINDPEKEVLQNCVYDKQEFGKIMSDINYKFLLKNINESRAAQQAFIIAFLKLSKDDSIAANFYKLSPMEICTLTKVSDSFSSYMTLAADTLNKKYSEYCKPLTSKEANKIAITMLDLLRNYEPTNYYKGRDIKSQELAIFLNAFSKIFTEKCDKQKELKNEFVNFLLNKYGGSARVLLDDSAGKITKTGKTEQIIIDYMAFSTAKFVNYIRSNRNSMNYLNNEIPNLNEFGMLRLLVNNPLLNN